MIKTADAVIIGGGVIGTSIAYHLVKGGVKNIALLEKNLLGSGSTGKSAGLTIHQWEKEIDIRLVSGSLEIYQSLIREEKDILFQQSGLVYLATTPAQEKYLRESAELLKRINIKHIWLDKPDIKKQLSWMQTNDFCSGLFTPEDGYFDPYEITSAFARYVRRNGGKIYEMCPVTGITVNNGRVSSVATNDGEIATSIIINASGCWSKEVGRLAGLNLPLKPYRTQIAVMKPSAPLSEQPFPAVYCINDHIYFRKETGGLLLAGDGTTETEENPEQYNQKVSSWFLEDMARKISFRIPWMSDAVVTNSWAGLCTATPDRLPIIGPVSFALCHSEGAKRPKNLAQGKPEIEGFILACGSNGYGFMRAGMLGKLVAEIATGKKPSLDIAPLIADRFAGMDVSDFKITQGMTV